MKRTTLIMEESCLVGIRDLARREKKNLSEVANELIAEGLQRRKAKIKQEFKLVSYSMGKPRVNLGDRNAWIHPGTAGHPQLNDGNDSRPRGCAPVVGDCGRERQRP